LTNNAICSAAGSEGACPLKVVAEARGNPYDSGQMSSHGPPISANMGSRRTLHHAHGLTCR
jgi:hypothetical protein